MDAENDNDSCKLMCKCVRLMIHTWIKDDKMHGNGIKCISKIYQTNEDEIRHFAYQRGIKVSKS